MTCNGTEYCQAGETATVLIIPKGLPQETIKVENSPVCVEIIPVKRSNDNKKCWHFWGTSNGNVTFEHFACGNSAYYEPNSGLQNNGAWLIVDGNIQNSTNYYYWSGTFGGITYGRFLQQVDIPVPKGGSSSGSCNSCAEAKYQVKIKNNNGVQVYQKNFDEQPQIKVSCDGCPPGYIKCKSNKYPGYCCIPCQQTAAKINNLAAKARCCNG